MRCAVKLHMSDRVKIDTIGFETAGGGGFYDSPPPPPPVVSRVSNIVGRVGLRR